MALQSSFSEQVLRDLLQPYGLGDILSTAIATYHKHKVIYDVTTTRGRYLVRFLSHRRQADARFEDSVVVHLAKSGLCVPRPLAGEDKALTRILEDKQQLTVFNVPRGRRIAVFEATLAHVRQVGEFVAEVHLSARNIRRQRASSYDPARIKRTLRRCLIAARRVSYKDDLQLIDTELHQSELHADLPRGVSHGFVSMRVVRFTQGVLSSVDGFEDAAQMPFLWDLAMAMSDWAFAYDRFLPERAHALVAGYEAVRELSSLERESLFVACKQALARRAALTFVEHEMSRERHKLPGVYQDYRHMTRRLHALNRLGESAFLNHVVNVSPSARSWP